MPSAAWYQGVAMKAAFYLRNGMRKYAFISPVTLTKLYRHFGCKFSLSQYKAAKANSGTLRRYDLNMIIDINISRDGGNLLFRERSSSAMAY